MTTGEKVAYYRKLKGITQKELAQKLGMTNSMLSMYEKGKYNLSPQLLEKIASELSLNSIETNDLQGKETLPILGQGTNSLVALDYASVLEPTLESTKQFWCFTIACFLNGHDDCIDFLKLLEKTKFSFLQKQTIMMCIDNLKRICKSETLSDNDKRAVLLSQADINFDNLEPRSKLIDFEKTADNISEKALQELENQVNSND